MFRRKTFGEFYFGYGYIIKANGLAAFITDKMYMVIVVVAGFTILFAQGV